MQQMEKEKDSKIEEIEERNSFLSSENIKLKNQLQEKEIISLTQKTLDDDGRKFQEMEALSHQPLIGDFSDCPDYIEKIRQIRQFIEDEKELLSRNPSGGRNLKNKTIKKRKYNKRHIKSMKRNKKRKNNKK